MWKWQAPPTRCGGCACNDNLAKVPVVTCRSQMDLRRAVTRRYRVGRPALRAAVNSGSDGDRCSLLCGFARVAAGLPKQALEFDARCECRCSSRGGCLRAAIDCTGRWLRHHRRQRHRRGREFPGYWPARRNICHRTVMSIDHIPLSWVRISWGLP